MYTARMLSDTTLIRLAARLAVYAKSAGLRVVTAESCTGGWVAKVLTDVAGSSNWFECGFVTYSNAAKVRDLGVRQRTLDRHGAVSQQTVEEMAAGALRVSGASLAVSISGIAGPDGGVPGKPVGTVWFCVASRARGRKLRSFAEVKRFKGDREAVRRRSVEHALRLLIRHVSDQ